MTTNVNNYFTKGPQGTLALLPKSNLSFKGERIPIYDNTEIDRWFVGDFSGASYFLTVEYDSNQKETMQVFVVARPEQASLTIFGRTSIEYELINIEASVTASYLSLTASPASSSFAGAKLSFIATYAETMGKLTDPTEVTYTGGPTPGEGGSGGSGGVTGSAFGTIYVTGQDDVIASTGSDGLNLIGGTGITLTSDAEGKSITFNSGLSVFKNFAVTGQSTLVADSSTDTLTITGGAGIVLSTNPTTDTLTISSSGTFEDISVTGDTTLANLDLTGDQTVSGSLSVTGAVSTGALTVNGNLTINGTTTTINSTTLDVDDINITIGKGAVSPASVDGGGITLDGAYATIVWDNASSGWSINKKLVPDVNDSWSLGTSTKKWTSIYATSLYGTIVDGSQNNITAVGTLNALTVSGAITGNGGITTTTLHTTGLADILTTTETVIDVVSSASVTYNFTSGAIFYHSSQPASDWTANFNNLPETNGKITTINIVVPQGGTGYKITAASVGGVSTTIKWLGSSTPTGNANKTDIWSFSFFRRSDSWTIYAAQSANFG